MDLQGLENIELEPLTSPEDVTSNSALLMKKIADDAPLDGMNVNGDKLLNKTKMFLIAQACNELNRVIKMTNLLETIEAKFIDAISEKLDENPHNLQLITFAMETISNSLARSNQLITQVLKDDKLSAIIINTNNIITPDGSTATVLSMDSRDAIRNWASSTFDMLRNMENNPDDIPNTAIDVPEEAIKETETNEQTN